MFYCTSFEKRYVNNKNTEITICKNENYDGYSTIQIEVWGNSENEINEARDFICEMYDNDTLAKNEIRNAEILYHCKGRYWAYSLECEFAVA